MAKYFGLIAQDGDAVFFEFGDYERAVVVQERLDILSSGDNTWKAGQLKVIAFADATQACIDATLARMEQALEQSAG